jgi:hypothetical protein
VIVTVKLPEFPGLSSFVVTPEQLLRLSWTVLKAGDLQSSKLAAIIPRFVTLNISVPVGKSDVWDMVNSSGAGYPARTVTVVRPFVVAVERVLPRETAAPTVNPAVNVRRLVTPTRKRMARCDLGVVMLRPLLRLDRRPGTKNRLHLRTLDPPATF